MIPATVTLKGIYAALILGAFGVLLILLGVQTVRIEGFKVWPIHTEGWKPKAERLQHDLDNVKAAQGVALQKAQAAKAATEKKYSDLAERTDSDAKEIHDKAMSDAERYIAAHRVHAEAAGGASRGASTAAEDRSAQGGDGAGGTPELDAVSVTADDVRICTTNTTRLEAVRGWALGLATPAP